MTASPALQHAAVPSPGLAPNRGLLQRKCACGAPSHGNAECRGCAKRHGKVQRMTAGGDGAGEVSPQVNAVLARAGQPLDAATRADMESRFGRDFSSIRIHADSTAAASARDVNANAYAVGQQIVFGSGQYAPHTLAGRRLLAHELTHTVQQGRFGSGVSPRLEVGAVDTAAEREADRIADRIVAGGEARDIHAAPEPLVQRQPKLDADDDGGSEPNFDSPQQRGGRARSAVIDAGTRGDDNVRVAVTRYLCDCVGRNVTRTHAATHVKPGPGVTLEICNGNVTGRFTGDIVPSSATTGRVTVRAEVNVAPGASGTGVKGGVEGEVRNTGSEPQVGGRADVRVKPHNGPEVGVGGEVFRGTQTGRTDTKVGAGVEVDLPIFGKTRIDVEATNPQDKRRFGGEIVIGGNLPGQNVENKTCRECRCPAVYECAEDIPPREVKESVDYNVDERGRLRYYFSLDTDRDTTDSVLHGESMKMLDEVAKRVAAGAHIVAITGYASPEDNREKPAPNQQLSLSRGKRVHDLLAAKLGAAQVPEAGGGGELFGRVATITPGSKLSDAITGVGFGDADDVTAFLIGTDIPNPQLADQFLALLGRVSEPADRLKLFGIDAASPAAPRLLDAVERFIASKGRGRRPWEGIFGFLRYATVELSTMRKQTREESHTTSGSLTAMSDAQCKPYARRAESESRFGAAAPEPKDEASCPPGDAHNPQRFASKCDYT